MIERRFVARALSGQGPFAVGSGSGVMGRGLLVFIKSASQLSNLGSSKLAMVGVFLARRSTNTTH